MRRCLFLLLVTVILLSVTNASASHEEADVSSVDMGANSVKEGVDVNMPDELPDSAFDESLNIASRRSIHPRYNPFHYRNTTITFAANDYAEVFINGISRRSIRNYRRHAVYSAYLRVGTVVVIKATNRRSWGGLIAAMEIRRPYRYRRGIRYRTYKLLTGRYTFRMRKAYRKARLNKLLKTRRVFSCRWPRNKRVRTFKSHTSKTFPYGRLKARYVWARGASRVGTVFLRFVIGGERCRRHPPSGLPKRCSCRKSRIVSPGFCLGFVGRAPRGTRVGRCRNRRCQPRYECVSRRLATTRCIRKYAVYELKKLRSRRGGAWLCRNKRLRRRKAFMAPYA